MTKSVDAFRTISEVAEELALPQHVLRFWETRFPQIKPLKRAGGRRFYRPHDVQLLAAIQHLLYEAGYTIKGVQRLLREQGSRGFQAGLKPAADAFGLAADGGMPPATLEAGLSLASDMAGSPDADPPPAAAAPSDLPSAAKARRETMQEALDSLAECERMLRAVLEPMSEHRNEDALNTPPHATTG